MWIYFNFQVSSLGELLNDLKPYSWTKSKYPLTMELLGFYYGFALYKTRISLQGKATLDVPGIRDRAVVYCDKVVRIFPLGFCFVPVFEFDHLFNKYRIRHFYPVTSNSSHFVF